MATEHARRSQDGEVEERGERTREPEQPGAPNVALMLQQGHGNQAVARMLSRTRRVVAREFDPEFTFGGGKVVKDKIDSQDSSDAVIETVIEDDLSGIESLFLQNDVATSPTDWADLALSSMEMRYKLVGIGQAQVVNSIRWLKDKYRERELLRLARQRVYDSSDVVPYSAENLMDRLVEAGMYLEVAVGARGKLTGRDAAVLEAIYETEGVFARTVVEFDAAKNILMFDEDNIVVLIDFHQQKHQVTQIPHFEAYTGDPGTKFAPGKDLEWHRRVTARVVKQTVQDAVADGSVTPATDALSPAKDAISGIVYDLTITYDDATGKYVGGYHCNPLRSES